jgi:hypothetical protein
VEIAVLRMRPDTLGVIVSQEILEAAALGRLEQKVKFVDMVIQVRVI